MREVFYEKCYCGGEITLFSHLTTEERDKCRYSFNERHRGCLPQAPLDSDRDEPVTGMDNAKEILPEFEDDPRNPWPEEGYGEVDVYGEAEEAEDDFTGIFNQSITQCDNPEHPHLIRILKLMVRRRDREVQEAQSKTEDHVVAVQQHRNEVLERRQQGKSTFGEDSILWSRVLGEDREAPQ